MSVLIISSLIVAFVAGMAALFAPCCITVLLPSYLGSIFKDKYKVVFMTFIFFLGILSVFLPIGLGVSAVSAFYREYHNTIFIFGGMLMFMLGGMLLLQKTFSMPFHVNPKLKDSSAGSVYVLGIFSGIATTCCAPVLAGVLALAALPGSLFWGGIYTFVYVLGMVAPLFIIAILVDKFDANKKIMIFRKRITYSFFGRDINISISDLISGIMFLFMGVLITYLAFTGNLTVHSELQVSTNVYFAKMTESIKGFIENLLR